MDSDLDTVSVQICILIDSAGILLNASQTLLHTIYTPWLRFRNDSKESLIAQERTYVIMHSGHNKKAGT